MSKDKAIDYTLSPKDAEWLLGTVLLPVEFRSQLLQKYIAERGQAALINLFAQFIGMANSVVANNRDSLETFLIVEKDWPPYEAEKINLPTIFGALNGVKLAYGIDKAKICHGCACRLGSLANQSPSTTCDVDWLIYGDGNFMCHENLDDQGEPTRKCRGFRQFKGKRRVAA